MTTYRGTTTYQLVYQELVTAARYRGVTTYQALAQIMGLPMKGSHMGKQVGLILGEIVEDEMASNRPMLSAVCVGVSGEPGPGFYALAREQGRFDGEGKSAEREFWHLERDAVYAAWQRTFK